MNPSAREGERRAIIRPLTAPSVRPDQRQGISFSSIPTPPGPKWLVGLLGIDFFAHVTSVTVLKPQTDAILTHLGRLRRLKNLGVQGTLVTNTGLAHLAGLSELRSLECSGTPELTDAGLVHLAGFERLEGLSIAGDARIGGPGLAHLAGRRHLRFLAIGTRAAAAVKRTSHNSPGRGTFPSTPLE